LEKSRIIEGTIKIALEVARQIPEFSPSYGKSEYEKRLQNKQSQILIATVDNKPVGFKAGYKEEHYFYSWMGGVIPKYRRKGIAAELAKFQEDWVKEKGLDIIRFKTQNKFKGMLLFAIKNGFSIIGTVPYNGGEGFKIVLEKNIKSKNLSPSR